MGGDEEDLLVDVRRVSRIFFTVESLVLSDVGQVLLLFKLDKHNENKSIDDHYHYRFGVDEISVTNVCGWIKEPNC